MSKYLRSGPGILLILLLISNFLNGGLSDPKTYFMNMLLSLPAIVIGISMHEFSHAFVSYKLGDPTPKEQGRVTINPMAHFDPFGLLALMFCGFGWGKPVEINPRYYKSPRRDEFLVSIAGVTMNIFIAVLFGFVVKFYLRANLTAIPSIDTMQGIILTIIINVIMINLVLAVFNLLPVPPLDGFSIITELFNIPKNEKYYKFYNMGFMILMLLLLLGIIDKVLYPGVTGLYSLILHNIIL